MKRYVSLFIVSLLAAGLSLPAIAKSKGPVHSLGGHFDRVMVFNSNCPEVVLGSGILLSTFSPLGKDVPENHLGYRFKGDFAIFMHHINKQSKDTADRTLFLNLLAHNPTRKTATLVLNSRATYCTRPDSPFVDRPALATDDANQLFSGPGDRVCADFVHGKAGDGKAGNAPLQVVVPAGETVIVEQIPVSVQGLPSPLNGRSFYALGRINGELELANVATFGAAPPSLSELNGMLQASLMAHPREYEKLRPSAAGTKGRFIYGRVCGVQKGSQLSSRINLVLRKDRDLVRYVPVSTLPNGTFGTGESQSAMLMRRYDDTAYSAHGNYCLRYLVTASIRNDDIVPRRVTFTFDCPIKSDQNEVVYQPGASKSMFFRGSLKLKSETYEKYFHLTMHKGDKLPPLESFTIAPRETRDFEVELYYPPDATPPQMLTIAAPQANI